MTAQSSPTPTRFGPPRPMLLLAVGAGLCWAAAVLLLISYDLPQAAIFAPLRMLFYLLILAASLASFLPIEQRLQTPGLTFEGTVGALLLFYTLAFVPPPSGPIFFLPDLPVYVLLLGALLIFVSALALPVVSMLGARLFQRRARQYDLRRARRQAHECGGLAAAIGALAALRILTPLSVLLVALILVVAETLFLAYIETPV